MKYIPLQQDSPLWLEWRKTGVGASDVATILGENEYKTGYQLWLELTGLIEPADLSKNPHIIRGKSNEPFARIAYEAYSNKRYPPMCIESDDYEALHASLDGYCQQHKQILEIKCPCPEKFQETLDKGTSSNPYKTYYPQVQYQLLVAGKESAESAILLFYDVDTRRMVAFKIFPDEQYQQNIENEVLKFWKYVIERNIPDYLLNPDKDLLTPELLQQPEVDVWATKTMELLKVLTQRTKLDQQVKKLKSQENILKKQIYTCFGGFKKGCLGGTKISVTSRKGSVNYSELLQDIEDLHGIKVDSDQYRGKDSTSIRLTIDGVSCAELEHELVAQKLKALLKDYNLSNVSNISNLSVTSL